jgi:hypothetical protein
MVTPNAIADGSATNIAASPPHKSPARFLLLLAALLTALLIKFPEAFARV